MTLTNGPTRVVPRSHHWPSINVPYVNQGDWEPAPLTPEEQAMVPTDLDGPYPGQVLVTAKAGSMVVINSSLWHAGTAKQDATARRVLHLTYTRRDLPQQLTQIDFLTPALWERMPPVHRWLLDIEPRESATQVLRQPKRDHKGWWA
jgi:ectoine hydroxylase-related dioxygenase (phytanoyl-CoA dioxygenase family)